MTMQNADPIDVANALIELRAEHPDKPMHELADMLDWEDFGPSEFQTTIGEETVNKYQAELLSRASQGDKYAVSMLAGMAFHEPGDD